MSTLIMLCCLACHSTHSDSWIVELPMIACVLREGKEYPPGFPFV